MISLHEHAGSRQPITLATIEVEARAFASARTELADELALMQAELDAVKKKFIRGIKLKAAKAAECQAALHTSIELSPALFTKPKTLTISGIKVGYHFSKGKIAFDDDATVVKLIKEHFPKQKDLLIHSKESPNKDGIKTLDEADLKKIACRIEDRGDNVVLSVADDDIEKMIGKLINDMVDVLLEEAA